MSSKIFENQLGVFENQSYTQVVTHPAITDVQTGNSVVKGRPHLPAIRAPKLIYFSINNLLRFPKENAY